MFNIILNSQSNKVLYIEDSASLRCFSHFNTFLFKNNNIHLHLINPKLSQVLTSRKLCANLNLTISFDTASIAIHYFVQSSSLFIYSSTCYFFSKRNSNTSLLSPNRAESSNQPDLLLPNNLS